MEPPCLEEAAVVRYSTSLIRSALRLALCLCAGLAVPTACGSPQPRIGAPGLIPHSFSQARPAKSQALLYVASINSYYEVNAYTFPQGDLVGPVDISSEPQAMCNDKAGDIFITEASSSRGQVAEYAHGAVDPKNVYPDPDVPYACAVDPTSGDLAVANQNRTIAIFNRKFPRLIPRLYSNPALESYYFTSYDSSGNLFVIAFAFASEYRLYELRQGTSTLRQVKVPFQICCPNWIQWDGHYLAMEVPKSKGLGPTVYQIAVADYKATIAAALCWMVAAIPPLKAGSMGSRWSIPTTTTRT